MSRLVGYTRPLSRDEDLHPDIRALKAAGASHVFAEGDPLYAEAGSAWAACAAFATAGDVVVVSAAERLAPTVTQFVTNIARLSTANVRFSALADPGLSTTAEADADPASVYAGLEVLRRRLRGMSSRSGMEAAAAAGRRPGRPTVMSPERVAIAEELRRQKRSLAHIARVLGVSPSAVQRALHSPTAPATS